MPQPPEQHKPAGQGCEITITTTAQSLHTPEAGQLRDRFVAMIPSGLCSIS